MALSDSWIDFLAGWCSGGAAVMACQPVDTVLTRLQAGEKRLVTARGLVQNVGMSSLWRGSSAMIGAVPMQNALLMGGYGIGKRWNKEEGALTAIFVGGCVGGIAQSFLMSPVELIKVNQQVAMEQSALATGKKVVSVTMIQQKAAWRGLGATLLRDGIPHGVWFVSYEVAKNFLEENSGIKSDDKAATTNWSIPLVSGAFAATVAWGVGYPFDLIKTRIQASTSTAEGTIWGTAQTLIKEANGNALQGLYRGFGLKLVRSVPASMIGFTTYELVKDSIERWE
ncbi:Mitochondrial aspartate-glutamate transporter AGC1 [Seminavis robusta]|uniref:Mitochondrial aspartate-glutamate transporter AGC1 n=1 Tax=Seminavis robusta TaxID=568900 RepID=A0A9N8DJ65_9STRA|nr:Mitochondrial aspartate-glutamate transporter AGC1 [Seminavis robusta]|eukprot:Sro157_g071040.1 Mitochondrial aspartate-glutamate transporter AGC1 (283) ;mRNA; f:13865-14810